MRTESDVRRNTQSVLIGTRSPGQVAEPSTSQTGDVPVIGAMRVGNRSWVGLDSHANRRGSWDASGLSRNSPRTHRPRTHNPSMIAGIFIVSVAVSHDHPSTNATGFSRGRLRIAPAAVDCKPWLASSQTAGSYPVDAQMKSSAMLPVALVAAC